jgi:hypothetical protein
MNIKLLYKGDLINEIMIDSEYQKFIISRGETNRSLISDLILFIEYLIDLDVNDYVFGREFILNDDIIINLKEADYKKINREDKIKNILSYGNK